MWAVSSFYAAGNTCKGGHIFLFSGGTVNSLIRFGDTIVNWETYFGLKGEEQGTAAAEGQRLEQGAILQPLSVPVEGHPTHDPANVVLGGEQPAAVSVGELEHGVPSEGFSGNNRWRDAPRQLAWNYSLAFWKL